MNRLTTCIGSIKMKSPIMTASGTSGHSDELTRIANLDIQSLGAFVTKGVTLHKREGNPQLRLIETRAGILNSIGLQNMGADYFLEKDLPALKTYNIPIIVNISADSIEQFAQLCAKLKESENYTFIEGIEINLSCPNIAAGGLSFGTDPKTVEKVVSIVKQGMDDKTIITKLTPNVTDITTIAKGAIAGGSDALCMINTLRGMAIDIDRQKPSLGNIIGGLSGPGIKPVGVFMVYECFRKIPECRDRNIPIIGVGGIMDFRDALEYILVGASAIEIGTGFFINPSVYKEVKQGINTYLKKCNKNLTTIIGAATA